MDEKLRLVNMEEAKKGLIYLYCVTDRVPKLKELDCLEDKLYFVFHQGLYAIASQVLEDEFNEENLKKNLNDMQWVKTKVGMHEKVIERIMRNSTVIPFKFATLFNSENSLKACLEKHAQEFNENLKHFEGKEEWGVKIYCNTETLIEAVIEETPQILKIKEEINSAPPGKAYFLKKKRAEITRGLVTKKLNEYGQETFEILKGISVDARINKLLPKEVTERENDMILNSAFLVEKNMVTEFMQAVETLKAKYNDKGIDFDCSGPWPAYNFVTTETRK